LAALFNQFQKYGLAFRSLEDDKSARLLAQTLDWSPFEDAFGTHHSGEGRLVLPKFHRLVGLLLLK
jgi:hypothetical protein